MNCPHCACDESKVVETRSLPHAKFRRRRCLGCEESFVSKETVSSANKMPNEINAAHLARLNAWKQKKEQAT